MAGMEIEALEPGVSRLWHSPKISIEKPADDTEPDPLWYKWRFGTRAVSLSRATVNRALGVLYGLFVMAFCFRVAPAFPSYMNQSDLKKAVGVLLVLLVSVGPPTWFWLEARNFEAWARTLPAWRREPERKYFELSQSHAKSFWAAFLAIASVVVVKFS